MRSNQPTLRCMFEVDLYVRHGIAVGWLTLAALWSPIYGQSPSESPNVLFLLADDLRADVLFTGRDQMPRTPNLDQLAARGQRFRRAIANNPVCVASRAEILTGCSSFRNGIFPGYSDELRADLITWSATMRDSGYRTVFVGKWHLPGRPAQRGYEQADGLFAEGAAALPMDVPVDSYGRKVTGYVGWVFQSADRNLLYPEKGVGLTINTDQEITDAAIRQICDFDRRPFFIHINFTAPHDPLLWPTGPHDDYQPERMRLPPNFLPAHPFSNGSLDNRDELLLPVPRSAADTRQELAIYYAIIARLDEQIGRILNALEVSGKLDNTYIIFSSDHGLAKGCHGLMGKQNMYEHTVNVPLVIAGPGIESGIEREAQVQLADLFPTICELVNLEIPKSVEGQSFANVLRGQATSIRDTVYAYFMSFQRMVRTDQFKLIVYPQAGRVQLFDLQADPYEIHDLSTDSSHAPDMLELRNRLRAWQAAVNDPLLKAEGTSR